MIVGRSEPAAVVAEAKAFVSAHSAKNVCPLATPREYENTVRQIEHGLEKDERKVIRSDGRPGRDYTERRGEEEGMRGQNSVRARRQER